MIPLVTCLILFCAVDPATGGCVPGAPLALVETREFVTEPGRMFLSAEKRACQRRFRELREISPAADERPVRFEVAREPKATEIAEGE